MHRNGYRKSSILLLAFMMFHVGMITYNLQWNCECDKHDESILCCCNCPECVDGRGGLFSYRLQNHFRPDQKKSDPVFVSPNCTCGSGEAVFQIVNDVPFLQPATLSHSLTAPVSPVSTPGVIVRHSGWDLSLDRPG